MDAYNCLRENGWYQGRKFGLFFTKICLVKEGYIFHSAAQNFLGEFGCIKIIENHSLFVKNGVDFDACRAAKGIDPSWVTQEYASRLNNPNLCVIGNAYEGHIVLFMDDENKVYGGFDDLLYYIADNPISAIDAIINGKPLSEIEHEN